MNLKYLTSARPTSGGDTLYKIKNHLVATCGWSVIASADGTSFSTSGTDYWTSGTPAQVAQAWIVLAPPAGTFRLLLQCQGSSHLVYRGKASPAAGFIAAPLNASGVTSGSISATACPSASDQVLMSGTTDDTGTNVGIPTALPADGTMVLHGFADTSAPYGFVFWGVKNNKPACVFALMLDPTTGGPAGDPDPWVAYLSGNQAIAPFGATGASGGLIEESATTYNGPVGWINRGGTGAVSGRVVAAAPYCNAAAHATDVQPGNVGMVLGPEDCQPVEYMRRAGLTNGGGYKGASTLLRWRGTSLRMAMETPSVTTARDSVVVDDVVTFWDGSNPQL